VKTSKQIKIDRLLGIFNSLFVNVIVRIIGKILRLNHSLDRQFKTIAVCKYKGMGSIIQSTPLLQTLRIHFPDAHIIYISTDSNKSILSKIHCINEVICINDKNVFRLLKSTSKMLILMWKRKIDVFIDLEIYSNFSSLITTLSLAKNRIGYYRQSSHYRMGIYTHMMYYNIKAPISNVYLQMANLFLCKETHTNIFPIECSLSKEELLLRFTIITEYIVINPNASDLRIERRWDKNKFIQLINQINSSFPQYQIILIGATNEKFYVDEVYANIIDKKNVLNLAGRTNLDELIAVIKYAKILITNDTGPMHLAYSLKTKTLALFGPCSPYQYGGNDNCYIVYKNVYCSPCVHEFDVPPCKGNNQCMQLISQEEVFEMVSNILLNNTVANNINKSIVYTSPYLQELLGLSQR